MNGITTGATATAFNPGGASDGRLNPAGFATRAQFAVILQRFFNGTVKT